MAIMYLCYNKQNMKNVFIILTFIIISGKISAQNETPKLPPDTIKFIFDSKPLAPINDFDMSKNLYPTKLTTGNNDLYLSQNDSLNISNKTNTSPDLLFVRSAYFTGESPLFADIGKNYELSKIQAGIVPFKIPENFRFRPIVTTRYQFNMFTMKWETMYIPVPLIFGIFSIRGMSGGTGFGFGLGLLNTKEEKLRKASFKKRTYDY
jgi:hypothetical protein